MPINSPLRLFIAAEVPAPLQQLLAEPLQALRQALPGREVAWVKSHHLHLTLKFLGDVPASQVDSIRTELASALQGQSAMALEIQGLGCFPNTRKPRIIWAGLVGELAALQALRQAIEEHIAPLGYPTEARPFQPHLTLGRVKSSHPPTLANIGRVVQAMPQQTIGHWICEHISLMQSHLSPQGATYETLARIAFD